MAHDKPVGGGKQVEYIGDHGENFEGRGSGGLGGFRMSGRQQRGGFGVFLWEGHDVFVGDLRRFGVQLAKVCLRCTLIRGVLRLMQSRIRAVCRIVLVCE